MKKLITFLQLLFITITIAQNGAPATPYYNGFNWTQTGMSLKTALATKITTTHTNNLSYAEVWNALKIVDLDPSNAANVFLVYGFENGIDADVTNDRTRNKNLNGGATGDWNREHIFAQSLGNPDLGQTGPGADAQMLRACDVQRNGTRANKLFGPGSGNSTTVGTFWYPGDEWKGDCARIIMYMYLRYGTQCLPTFVATGTTVSTDVNMPNLLLQWNAEDPVSQYEDTRNTYLGSTTNTYGQGNRNPFIDNPYLATAIWGGPIAQNRWPAIFLSTESNTMLTDVIVYPNPTYDHRINIDSKSKINSIQLLNLNGQIIMELKNTYNNSNSVSLDNIPTGFYFLKLSSNDNKMIKKILVE